jgi:MoxR-like ATPase
MALIALTPQPRDVLKGVQAQLEKVILGKPEVIRDLLTALLGGGHILMEDVPGVGKTTLAKALARAFDAEFKRVQFTPDLLPSDILGSSVYSPRDGSFTFKPGPIFANILLADEINRTPPKTQAALLEAMQEYQVTVGGERYELDRPLFVLATQNPIEQEGTYPLPEAQLDRFMFNVVIEYPSAEEERRILSTTTGTLDPRIEAVASGEEIERLHTVVRDVPAAENIVDYAARLVRATRPTDEQAPEFIRKWVRWGAGPRAGQSLLLGGKARALLEGRTVVDFDDIRAVAPPVLRHRVLMNFQAEADGVDSDEIVRRLLDSARR